MSDAMTPQQPEIWIDADACPVREEVFRVAGRHSLVVHVVSNGARGIRLPEAPWIRRVLVPEGPDAADDWIAAHIRGQDVCITADIPLAARCLERGARALAPNGRLWTTDNIGSALAGREVARHLREIGANTRGPSAMGNADRSRFLSALENEVQAAMRGASTAPLRLWRPLPDAD
ncbi:YaiI/YqxD family protein [Roseomonas sp. E05]|uniref:YaiI/YqxD family protein n=1 Tax=Roseomonas sp. E05 TaxID=3046310 RepID=UPI0024BA9F7F|nr:YaiI/YqxD family protein [Roseomonas sp. E05]MDJ0388311.1 YaiI/YqxD family protein [Roseomonas sp. E05]